jgi:hypothetical protein
MTFAAKGPPPGHGGDPLELSSLGGVDTQEVKQNRPEVQVKSCNQAALREARLNFLACRLHGLGPKPLFYFLDEVERGEPLRLHLERYAALPANFIKIYGGDRFTPSLHCIDGGAP